MTTREPIRPDHGIEIRLPDTDNEPPETQLAVLVLADALNGESVTWPAEHEDGWRVLEHLARQVPGASFAITFPTGGGIVSTNAPSGTTSGDV